MGYIIAYCICEMIWISGFCAFMESKRNGRNNYWSLGMWEEKFIWLFILGIVVLPAVIPCMILYNIFLLIFNKKNQK
jgi:O-antigen/teichoic acid export membrane protein